MNVSWCDVEMSLSGDYFTLFQTVEHFDVV